jgi:hypothetical protein
MKSNLKKGFTILELVLAMGILMFVLFLSADVLKIFSKVGANGVKLYKAQGDVRRTVSFVSSTLKNAGAIYLLSDKFFNETRNEGLPLEYNYLGVEKLANGRSQLVHYVLNEDGTAHNRIVVAESNKDGDYRLTLDKNISETGEESLVGLKVVCETLGISAQELEASFRALNASYVTDWSSGADAIAIAYVPVKNGISVTFSPEIKDGAAIYMILDNSGSMALSMTSDTESPTDNVEDYREYHLKVAGKKFFERLTAYENVYLGVQGFDTVALRSSHQSLLNLSDASARSLYSNLFDPDYFLSNYSEFTGSGSQTTQILHAHGGTNMGDGLRMGYHNMISDAQMLGISGYKKYMMVISDGESTAYTVPFSAPDTGSDIADYFYYENLEAPIAQYWIDYPTYMNVNRGYVPVNGLKSAYTTLKSEPLEYAKAVARMIANSGDVKDCFLVAIGELNLSSLNQIANALGIATADFPSHVFKANDELNFYVAIESIAESISLEIEKILGSELLEGILD